MKKRSGFTLIEFVIVIAVISILAGIALPKINNMLRKTRDTRRKADLRKVESALAAYFTRNGTFPSTGLTWYSSEPGDPAAGNNGGNWIPNLAPIFIPKLPRDPQGGPAGAATCGGNNYFRAYCYKSDGTNYKLVAQCGPENTTASDPFNDPVRSAAYHAWMVCSGEAACTSW